MCFGLPVRIIVKHPGSAHGKLTKPPSSCSRALAPGNDVTVCFEHTGAWDPHVISIFLHPPIFFLPISLHLVSNEATSREGAFLCHRQQRDHLRHLRLLKFQNSVSFSFSICTCFFSLYLQAASSWRARQPLLVPAISASTTRGGLRQCGQDRVTDHEQTSNDEPTRIHDDGGVINECWCWSTC